MFASSNLRKRHGSSKNNALQLDEDAGFDGSRRGGFVRCGGDSGILSPLRCVKNEEARIRILLETHQGEFAGHMHKETGKIKKK